MQKYTDGYVTQFPYTYGYFQELNPLTPKLQFLAKGIPFPKIRNACELGYGLGVSINIHAAASAYQWWGTDFNPDQAAFAQALSEASGAKASLAAESFAEFLARSDLPQFEFIGMHGIWSWVNAESKKLLLEFLDKYLAIGGILYISYNTIPGWSAMRPLRDLMALHMECSPTPDIREGIRAAIAFARRFLDIDSRFSADFPGLKEILAKMSGQSEVYLAHEFFNKDWDCVSFAEMRGILGKIGLQYVCQPAYLDSVDILNLSDAQLNFVRGASSEAMRETLTDFFQERKFRRDYWIRGGRELSYVELCDNLPGMSFMLIKNPDNVSLKAVGAEREADLNEKIARPLLEIFADGLPHSLFEVIKAVGDRLGLGQILHFANTLCSNGCMAPTQDFDAETARRCHNLNAYIEGFAISGNGIGCLASPLLGGGVPVSQYEQIFLLARDNGSVTAEAMATFARQQLSAAQKMPGIARPPAVPTLADLTKLAQDFRESRLPLLINLKTGSSTDSGPGSQG